MEYKERGGQDNFKGFNHGTDKIDLGDIYFKELMPVEIHIKENGSILNEPSIAIVMEGASIIDRKLYIIGQISLDMFNKGLKDIGYEMIKIKE